MKTGGRQTILNVAVWDRGVNLVRLPLSQDRWIGRAPELTN